MISEQDTESAIAELKFQVKPNISATARKWGLKQIPRNDWTQHPTRDVDLGDASFYTTQQSLLRYDRKTSP